MFRGTLQLTDNHEEWIDCAARDSKEWCHVSILNGPFQSLREVDPDMLVEKFSKDYDCYVLVRYSVLLEEWFPVQHELWDVWKKTKKVNLLFCRKPPGNTSALEKSSES